MPQHAITVTGNLTADPILKSLKTGALTTEIRIAASRSIRDEDAPTGWRDIDHLFITGKLWGQLAENAKASLCKGMPVIASGRIVTEEWVEVDKLTGKEAPRQQIVMKVERIGLDLSKYVVSSKRTDIAEHQVDGLMTPGLPNTANLIDKNFAPDEQEAGSHPENAADSQFAGAGVGGGESSGDAGADQPAEQGGGAPF